MYRYEKVRDVETENDTQNLDFGLALHGTIEDVCEEVRGDGQYSDEDIFQLVDSAFERNWLSETDSESYRTEADYKDDKTIAKNAIHQFFTDGPGLDHTRRSLVTELKITFERNGVEFVGYIDNVLATESGLELVDYKKSDIKPPVKRNNYIKKHLNGEYRPRRLKPAIQALLYMEGIKQTTFWDSGDEIEFTYQTLSETTVDRSQPEMVIEVTQDNMHVADDVRENESKLWTIIEEAVEGIQSGEFAPDPFDEILDEYCERCEYQSMCAAYLNKEEQKI